MAYNPLYTQPQNYQLGQTQFTPYYAPLQVASQQQSQVQSSIIWVHGIQAANSFMIAPNSTVALWDIDSQKIFLKSADNSGMTSIRTLKYVTEEENTEPVEPSKYVSYDDLENLENRIAEKIGNLSNEIYKFRKNEKRGVTVDG